MVRKIFRTGNSLVVSLPRESLQNLGLVEGSEVEIVFDEETRTIMVTPARPGLANIDETFAQQLHEFIEQYRPALEALAK